MKDKREVGLAIQLRTDNVLLTISVQENLKSDKLSGYIEVDNGQRDSYVVFWDNVEFFIKVRKKEFKEECLDDIIKTDLDWKEVYKDLKALIKKAKKLKLID